MPGWGKPQYEMKQADIPKGDIPKAFDWRDKGRVYEHLRVLWSLHKMVVCVTGCNPFHFKWCCWGCSVSLKVLWLQ